MAEFLKQQQFCTKVHPNILIVFEIEICNSFSFFQSILPFDLPESGLFTQNEAVLYKDPNIPNVFFFWLSESGLFGQKAAVSWKGILNVVEIL